MQVEPTPLAKLLVGARWPLDSRPTAGRAGCLSQRGRPPISRWLDRMGPLYPNRRMYPNTKELRPAHAIRVLFAFDPRRVAILLIGGDKRGSWNRWYDEMVPVADTLYDGHLAEVGDRKVRRE